MFYLLKPDEMEMYFYFKEFLNENKIKYKSFDRVCRVIANDYKEIIDNCEYKSTVKNDEKQANEYRKRKEKYIEYMKKLDTELNNI